MIQVIADWLQNAHTASFIYIVIPTLLIAFIWIQIYTQMVSWKYVIERRLQIHVIRIMLMVPLYSICSFLGLRYPSISFLFRTIREVYESIALYSFYQMLSLALGGDRSLALITARLPPQPHPWPLDSCFPPFQRGGSFVWHTKVGTLQFVLFKPLLVIISLICELFGVLGEGSMSPATAYIYIAFLTSVSQMYAIYCMVLLYFCVHEQISPIRPLHKFFSIKMIIFFTYWQGLLISILLSMGIITNNSKHDASTIAIQMQEFLICFEMLLFALYNIYAFQSSDFENIVQQQNDRLARIKDEKNTQLYHLQSSRALNNHNIGARGRDNIGLGGGNNRYVDGLGQSQQPKFGVNYYNPKKKPQSQSVQQSNRIGINHIAGRPGGDDHMVIQVDMNGNTSSSEDFPHLDHQNSSLLSPYHQNSSSNMYIPNMATNTTAAGNSSGVTRDNSLTTTILNALPFYGFGNNNSNDAQTPHMLNGRYLDGDGGNDGGLQRSQSTGRKRAPRRTLPNVTSQLILDQYEHSAQSNSRSVLRLGRVDGGKGDGTESGGVNDLTLTSSSHYDNPNRNHNNNDKVGRNGIKYPGVGGLDLSELPYKQIKLSKAIIITPKEAVSAAFIPTSNSNDCNNDRYYSGGGEVGEWQYQHGVLNSEHLHMDNHHNHYPNNNNNNTRPSSQLRSRSPTDRNHSATHPHSSKTTPQQQNHQEQGTSSSPLQPNTKRAAIAKATTSFVANLYDKLTGANSSSMGSGTGKETKGLLTGGDDDDTQSDALNSSLTPIPVPSQPQTLQSAQHGYGFDHGNGGGVGYGKWGGGGEHPYLAQQPSSSQYHNHHSSSNPNSKPSKLAPHQPTQSRRFSTDFTDVNGINNVASALLDQSDSQLNGGVVGGNFGPATSPHYTYNTQPRHHPNSLTRPSYPSTVNNHQGYQYNNHKRGPIGSTTHHHHHSSTPIPPQLSSPISINTFDRTLEELGKTHEALDLDAIIEDILLEKAINSQKNAAGGGGDKNGRGNGLRPEFYSVDPKLGSLKIAHKINFPQLNIGGGSGRNNNNDMGEGGGSMATTPTGGTIMATKNSPVFFGGHNNTATQSHNLAQQPHSTEHNSPLVGQVGMGQSSSLLSLSRPQSTTTKNNNNDIVSSPFDDIDQSTTNITSDPMGMMMDYDHQQQQQQYNDGDNQDTDMIHSHNTNPLTHPNGHNGIDVDDNNTNNNHNNDNNDTNNNNHHGSTLLGFINPLFYLTAAIDMTDIAFDTKSALTSNSNQEQMAKLLAKTKLGAGTPFPREVLDKHRNYLTNLKRQQSELQQQQQFQTQNHVDQMFQASAARLGQQSSSLLAATAAAPSVLPDGTATATGLSFPGPIVVDRDHINHHNHVDDDDHDHAMGLPTTTTADDSTPPASATNNKSIGGSSGAGAVVEQ